jgi:hypothetical protein
MIPASMPKLQFSCLGADRPSEELVAKTDPKVGNLLPQDACDQVETGVEVGGITRAGRYHYSIRLKSLNRFRCGAERNDGHPTSPLDERSHNISLYSAIDYHDVRPGALKCLRCRGCHLSDDVALPRKGSVSRTRNEVLITNSSGILDDDSSCVADIPDVQSQGTRIDA